MKQTKNIALGGVLVATALVVMCMGGLIPFSTYACPAICLLIGTTVLHFCGRRVAWAWYGTVAILCILIGPDKEASMVYTVLGAYPLLKTIFEKWPGKWVWKFLYFNIAIISVYWVLIHLFGMTELIEENMEFGYIGLGVLMVLGNLVFVLLDKLITKLQSKLNRKYAQGG